MLHVFRTPLRCGLILTAFFSAAPAASAAPARIVRGMEATDAWMLAPTPAEQAFMRALLAGAHLCAPLRPEPVLRTGRVDAPARVRPRAGRLTNHDALH